MDEHDAREREAELLEYQLESGFITQDEYYEAMKELANGIY